MPPNFRDRTIPRHVSDKLREGDGDVRQQY
jgi:hypothetical protein